MELLKDKTAVVTGGGRGIGRAVAKALAAEGARVVVNDAGTSALGEPEGAACALEVTEELRASGAEALESRHDVSDPEAAAALIALAVEHFGAVDVLVNCAGVGQDAPLHRLSAKDWGVALGAQLSGSFHCLRAAAARMKAQGGGSIVNTTGIAGLRGNFGQAHAAAAAAGVVGLTLTASAELQRSGVRVNAVAPLAKTRLTEHLPLFAQVDTMGPEQIAAAYVFLASPLSAAVTGTVLGAAGGKLSVFRVVETLGALKETAEGPWTPEQIAEHWPTIAKL